MTTDKKEIDCETIVQPADQYDLYRDRYQILIEDAADGFYEINLAGDIIFCNKGLNRILGYSNSEIKNHNYREFMDSKNAQSADHIFSRINDPETQLTQIEWKIIHKNGEERTLDVSARAIFNPAGKKIGYRGTVRDVTNRYRAQAAAIASEKQIRQLYLDSKQAQHRYRTFLKFIPIPVVVQALDYSIEYINPAFEQIFGWSQIELKGNPMCFIPEEHIPKTQTGKMSLLKNGILYGLETQRLTKDGRLLDVIYDGAALYNAENEITGLVVTLRDITQSKRDALITQALFRIAESMHHYRDLDGLLAFITREIKTLMGVDRTHVLLLTKEQNEFFFRAGAYDDPKFSDKYLEKRISAEKGIAGQVYRTGEPIIVNDYQSCYVADFASDIQPDTEKRNMLQVPLWVETQMIGVLCVVNKKEGDFDKSDVNLLSAVASMVALPIENARINQILQNSYDTVKSLNNAKDRVIDHLSHELKTPMSVLSASMDLLTKKSESGDLSGVPRIIERCQRNIGRILEMQYELADIIRQKDEAPRKLLSHLLDVCRDELESIVEGEVGESAADRVRNKLDEEFGSSIIESEILSPGLHVANKIEILKPFFAHRRIQFVTDIEPTDSILIPPEVLNKIVTCLVRNAVEYTPDGGCVVVTINNTTIGPALTVRDTGVGITAKNKSLILENYFTTAEPIQYSTRRPYDFNAGGRGFDLLRMKIFSERYHFQILLDSIRCFHVPTDSDVCPGGINDCHFCKIPSDCQSSGGTRFTIQFLPASNLDL